MKRFSFSTVRTGLIARHTFGEAVRMRVFQFLLILAVTFVLGSLALREFDFGGAETKFLTDFGLGALVCFGSILTVVVTTQLFFREIEHRTVLTLLARPVLRSEFILGKFLGAWLVSAVFCALVVALLCGLLATMAASPTRGVEAGAWAGGAVHYGDVVLAGVLQAVKFGALTALTLFVGSFSRSGLFAVAMSFLILAVCHLQYLAHDAWRAADSILVRVGATLLNGLFPNFQLFSVGDRVASGQSLTVVPVAGLIAYGLAYGALYLFFACACFRRREL